MCVIRVMNLTAEGRGLHIKISTAVCNVFVEQWCGHTAQSNGGHTAEREDDDEGMHRCTFTCKRTVKGVSVDICTLVCVRVLNVRYVCYLLLIRVNNAYLNYSSLGIMEPFV